MFKYLQYISHAWSGSLAQFENAIKTQNQLGFQAKMLRFNVTLVTALCLACFFAVCLVFYSQDGSLLCLNGKLKLFIVFFSYYIFWLNVKQDCKTNFLIDVDLTRMGIEPQFNFLLIDPLLLKSKSNT